MKRLSRWTTLILIVIALGSCRGERPRQAEKTYPLHGTIVGRQPADNSLVIRHDAVEGLMEGMTMPFPVRGAQIADLPPNGAEVDATLHMGERSYWITDVKPAAGRPEGTATSQDPAQ